MERRTENPAPNSSVGPLQGARILVVEDDFFISMELESILSEAGGEVVDLCHTVEEALAAIEKDGLSVALLDYRMGRETTEDVARSLDRRRVPFAFYTGQAEVDPLRAEWPDCEIVSKPARPQALVKTVADLIGRNAH
jgi:DNA-binding NtrC family response regulator